MLSETLSPEERELQFYKGLIKDYLTYGSVDEVFRHAHMDLPISYPGFHHLLNRWGIVKAAGPNTKFSETLSFFARMVEEDLGIEKLYRQMPPSFKESTSLKTLYRILQHIRSGIDRRAATALVIHAKDNPNFVLIGKDVSVPRLEYGKPYGSLSLPMGFSKRNEPNGVSILRVLQREVFTDATVERNFPYEVIPDNPKPFLNILAADVSVSVYKIEIEEKHIGLLSSYILSDLQLHDYKEITGLETQDIVRAGVPEILNIYGDIKDNSLAPLISEVSSLNLALANYP